MKREILVFAVKAFVVILLITIAVAVLSSTGVIDLDFDPYSGRLRP